MKKEELLALGIPEDKIKAENLPARPDYFSLSVRLLADVPEKNLPDVYSVIRGLARPQQ